MTLKKLGFKYKTDKATHGYLDIYESYIGKLENVQNVVEIGVRTGASLRMWAEYFPNSHIDGVDINPECKKHESNKISVFIGDQTDHEFLDTLKPEYDFIVDDGSHVNEWTVATFNFMFPRLRKGGIYILEDMQCSYQDLEQVNVRDKWSGMDLVPQIPDQQRITIDNLISALSHRVDAGEIQSVHLHKNFILVIK